MKKQLLILALCALTILSACGKKQAEPAGSGSAEETVQTQTGKDTKKTGKNTAREITREAKGYYNWINDNIWDLNRMQKQPEEVAAEPGEQCTRPYECWYYAYCHGEQKDPVQLEITSL